jgi:hypothetical protein
MLAHLAFMLIILRSRDYFAKKEKWGKKEKTARQPLTAECKNMNKKRKKHYSIKP